MVDELRRPKPAYQQIRTLFCPARTVEVTGRSITVQVRGKDEIPSYPMRGYRIVWGRLEANSGFSLVGGVDMPTLKPGDPAWSGELPRTLDLSTGSWAVRLMSPTGFDVAEVRIGTKIPDTHSSVDATAPDGQ